MRKNFHETKSPHIFLQNSSHSDKLNIQPRLQCLQAIRVREEWNLTSTALYRSYVRGKMGMEGAG